jgi:hypothetical protein
VEEESFRHLVSLSQAKSTTAITSKQATTSVMTQASRCRAKLFETLTNKASENCGYYQAHFEKRFAAEAPIRLKTARAGV